MGLTREDPQVLRYAGALRDAEIPGLRAADRVLAAMDRGSARSAFQLVGAGGGQGNARLQGSSAGGREKSVRPGRSAGYAHTVIAQEGRRDRAAPPALRRESGGPADAGPPLSLVFGESFR